MKKSDVIEPKIVTKLRWNGDTYNDFSHKTRKEFIDQMLEGVEKRGRIVWFDKEFGIKPRIAWGWWERYPKKMKCHTNF